ncbi:MAG: bifunctional phosphoribosyl-AMP cyclohydrolase/phosphoribosyl-ATP diphosphatase HisIE [Acidimicrobiia bacterium]
MMRFADLSAGPDGLVVAVVQDAATRSVLMVAYMNEEAFDATQASGRVHFWSRSRNELWRKGATSGNTLALADIRTDCDGDALLVLVNPTGPACHTGSTSCFGDQSAPIGATIDRLAEIIRSREGADPGDSYTAGLIADPDLAARKVLEEAGEVAFAAKDLNAGGSSSRVVEEAADEVYHLLALLASLGIDPDEVGKELTRRMVGGTDS